MIGESMRRLIIMSLDPKLGIERGIAEFVSLKQSESQEPWLHPFINESTLLIAAYSTLELKRRLYIGVAISYTDFVTDVIMIVKFASQKEILKVHTSRLRLLYLTCFFK